MYSGLSGNSDSSYDIEVDMLAYLQGLALVGPICGEQSTPPITAYSRNSVDCKRGSRIGPASFGERRFVECGD